VDPSWPAPPPGWQFWILDEPLPPVVQEWPEQPIGYEPRESEDYPPAPGSPRIAVIIAVIVAVVVVAGVALWASSNHSNSRGQAPSQTDKLQSAPALPEVGADNIIRSMAFPAGSCGNGSTGWEHTVPITVTNGKGEAQTSAGQFGGASITDAKLVGPLDADGDGTADAVISFTCFGSTFDMCCAGRTSMMKFLRVFNFSNPSSPEPIGETIMPGASPVRGETYGEIRYFDHVRIDGSAIVTDEKLVYADTSGATADLGFPPDSTIEVTHQYTDGGWVSTERVLR
jgi:hypothetical protein